MEAIKERIAEAKDNLAVMNDREYDVFLKGMIKAFNELLDMQLSEGEQIDEI